MKALSVIKIIGVDILKGLAAAIVIFPGLIVGGLFTGLLGLTSPETPAYINMTTIFPLMMISGIIIAITLGECYRRLHWSFWPRMLAIWLTNYLLYNLLNLLDGLLFTPFPHMSTGIISYLFPALFSALVIAWLWKAEQVLPTREQISGFFSTRTGSSWAWRIAAAWLIYPAIYCLVGRVVALFTINYYQDPNSNLGLTLPPLGTLLLMQVLRGALFLLAVAPILVSWRGKSAHLWGWIGTVIFVLIANQVIIQAYWMPFDLRAPHALELLVDSFVQAAVYVWLLYQPIPSANRVSEPALVGEQASV